MSFFNIFSNRTNHTSDTDSDSDSDTDEQTIGREVYRENNKTIYVADARSFYLSCIKTWVFNRSLNDEHVDMLKSEILKANHPDFMGTFKLVCSTSGEKSIRIIDGQHRMAALSKIIESDSKFNMNIILEVYNVSDIDGPESWQLFSKANNVLNVQEKDKSISGASYITSKLAQEFPLAVYDPKKLRVNFPSIDKRLLFERLKKSSLLESFTEDEVLKMILKKNLDLSKQPQKYYTRKVDEKFQDKLEKGYKKCYKTGCYLGLHVTDPLYWIRELEAIN